MQAAEIYELKGRISWSRRLPAAEKAALYAEALRKLGIDPKEVQDFRDTREAIEREIDVRLNIIKFRDKEIEWGTRVSVSGRGLGVVTGFSKKTGWAIVKLDTGKVHMGTISSVSKA